MGRERGCLYMGDLASYPPFNQKAAAFIASSFMY